MKVELLDKSLFKLKGSGVDRTDAKETGKLHLTDIIRFIDYKLNFSNFKGGDWDGPTMWELGFSWEDALEDALGNRYAARVGEIEKDGIVGSPDGINYDPLGKVPLVNEEYKLTWKSSRNDIEQHWYYMTQFQSYCYMLGVNVTVAHVFYVMGDYRGSGPQWIPYRFEFLPEELEANWEMIKTHEKMMRKEGLWRAPDLGK